MEIHPWCGSQARKPPKRLGDGPMFCKVLRIVFTLFFLFLLGSQYPVSLGPMVWLLNHVFCFYWAPSTPFLRARQFGCSSCFIENSFAPNQPDFRFQIYVYFRTIKIQKYRITINNYDHLSKSTIVHILHKMVQGLSQKTYVLSRAVSLVNFLIYKVDQNTKILDTIYNNTRKYNM